VLLGLSPTYIGSFVADHPCTAFIAMGGVVPATQRADSADRFGSTQPGRTT
jgi:hypothetical protein